MALRIAVFIKQVPATDDIKVDEERGTLIRDGIPLTLNPHDAHSIELALSIKDSSEATVIAATMGPPQAKEILTTAISMGVDEIFLLSDRAFAGSDTWSTAKVLAAFAKTQGPFDLIVCGDHSSDGETGQVGPQIAEFLNIPSATMVVRHDGLHDKRLSVTRRYEFADVSIELPLPALITVSKDVNEPRIPSLRGMMRAKTAEPQILDLTGLELSAPDVGLEGSPTKVSRLSRREHDVSGAVVEGTVDEQVNALVSILETKGVI